VIFNYAQETLINKMSVNEIAEIKFNSGRIQKFKNIIATNESPYVFDIPEPKYVGYVYQIDEHGKILNTLEQQKSSLKSNLNASAIIVGVGKSKTKSQVKGKQSTVRLKKGKILLIAKVKDSKINPKEIFNVFHLKVNKNKRFVQVSEANTFGTTNVMDIDFLSFKTYPYKKDSFIIELDIKEKGEFAVTLDNSRGTFNMFGIDD